MENMFEQSFQGRRSELAKTIDVDHGLWSLLQDKNVLTVCQVADCMSMPTAFDQVERMFDILAKCDDALFEPFYEALVENDQKCIADKLRAQLKLKFDQQSPSDQQWSAHASSSVTDTSQTKEQLLTSRRYGRGSPVLSQEAAELSIDWKERSLESQKISAQGEIRQLKEWNWRLIGQLHHQLKIESAALCCDWKELSLESEKFSAPDEIHQLREENLIPSKQLHRLHERHWREAAQRRMHWKESGLESQKFSAQDIIHQLREQNSMLIEQQHLLALQTRLRRETCLHQWRRQDVKTAMSSAEAAEQSIDWKESQKQLASAQDEICQLKEQNLSLTEQLRLSTEENLTLKLQLQHLGATPAVKQPQELLQSVTSDVLKSTAVSDASGSEPTQVASLPDDSQVDELKVWLHKQAWYRRFCIRKQHIHIGVEANAVEIAKKSIELNFSGIECIVSEAKPCVYEPQGGVIGRQQSQMTPGKKICSRNATKEERTLYSGSLKCEQVSEVGFSVAHLFLPDCEGEGDNSYVYDPCNEYKKVGHSVFKLHEIDCNGLPFTADISFLKIDNGVYKTCNKIELGGIKYTLQVYKEAVSTLGDKEVFLVNRNNECKEGKIEGLRFDEASCWLSEVLLITDRSGRGEITQAGDSGALVMLDTRQDNLDSNCLSVVGIVMARIKIRIEEEEGGGGGEEGKWYTVANQLGNVLRATGEHTDCVERLRQNGIIVGDNGTNAFVNDIDFARD